MFSFLDILLKFFKLSISRLPIQDKHITHFILTLVTLRYDTHDKASHYAAFSTLLFLSFSYYQEFNNLECLENFSKTHYYEMS
jgi:hypothetical protein